MGSSKGRLAIHRQREFSGANASWHGNDFSLHGLFCQARDRSAKLSEATDCDDHGLQHWQNGDATGSPS